MESKSILQKYVKATLRRLRVEKIIYLLQTGLFLAVLAALLIIFASRLFVLPYYSRFAYIAAGAVLIGTIIYSLINRVKTTEAVRYLDSFVPTNIILTALSIEKSNSSLAPVIIEEGASKVSEAYFLFKKRKKKYLNSKMATAFIACTVTLIVLLSFPSDAQLEAEAIEQEKLIVEEIRKEVKELLEEEKLPEVKKELAQLSKDLEEAETSEEAMKELVKKQKEMRLKEQRLAEKKKEAEQSSDPSKELTDAEEQELEELREVASKLAQQAGKANTALNKIGKAPALPALADAGNSISNVNDGKGTSGSESTGTGGKAERSDGNNGQGSKEDGSSAGEGDGEGNGEGTQPGSGEGPNSGSGSGSGSGQGDGPGEASGNGSGSGAGEGTGIGKGSGGRDLLSIPSDRVGTVGDPSVDGGKLGEGDFIEERESEGLTERGTVRPYDEVIGNYKQSYLESTGKMKLSPDLQRILSNYFTSIE